MAKKQNDRSRRRAPLKPRPKRYRTLDVVDYKDVDTLAQFVSERGKIRTRRVTGLSRRQQAEVAKAIKQARELSLMPAPKGR